MLPGGFRDLLWYDVNDVMKISQKLAKKMDVFARF